MRYVAEVIEKVTTVRRYWLDAEDDEDALIKAENGETLKEEDKPCSSEVVDRSVQWVKSND